MKVLIVGNGVSGKSAYEFLLNKGYVVSFADDNDIETDSNLKDKKYQDRLFDGLSFIVTSPGVPKSAPIFKYAKQRKIKIICEFELGCSEMPSKTIAVTGTNGKTTTVKLINHLLHENKNNVFLGGNVGVPVTKFAAKTTKKDIVILEASSFQLDWSKNFAPNIAAILNISADHLSWHKNMKNYIRSKLKITKKQTANDYLILNADDEILMQNIPKTKAQIFYFSTEKRVVGCYCKNGNIYFNDNLIEKKLVSAKNIRLVGNHNLSNVLCACLVVFLLTKSEKFLKNISSYQGESHRIEYVKTIKGISFFNDSKATNISSTLVATKSFSANINLILGGSDKGYNFDELFAKLPKNVKNIAVFGQTKQKIAISAKKFKFKNIYFYDTLKSCTKALYCLSNRGDIVLLSPACASFDQFSNYAERGDVFKKIVEEISFYENAFAEIEKGKKI